MTIERLALTQPIDSRTGSFAKDSYSSNCVFETTGGGTKRELIKRPGLVKATQVVAITPPAYTQCQGLTEYNGTLICAINNIVYQVNPTTYVKTTLGSVSTSTSQSYFVRTFLDAYLFMHNKVDGYLLNKAGTKSQITNDKVISITIDNPGLNYSSGITLSFSGGGGVAATATVTLGKITAVTISAAGSGLTVTPTCTITLPANRTPTGTGSIGLFTVTVSSATGIYVGMAVTGTGVALNAVVTNINALIITLDIANDAAVSGTITFKDLGSNGVLTPVLNAGPAGPYVSGAVFLDNYIFVGTTDNRIYNSNLGDPTSWSALSYLSFEQTTDTLVAITKHLNYLVAFGSNSTQFFYDLGSSVGSPLGLAPSYTSEVGCASGDSVVATSNTVLWIGKSKTYGKCVYIMDGVSPIKVSTPNVDRHLEADNLSSVTAFCYKVSGHTLYVLNLYNTSKTLVYDLDEKMWYTWTQYSMASNDQPNPGVYSESYFRPAFYAEVNNVPYVLDDDTATLYYFSTSIYEDNSQAIYCRVITDIRDNGTTKRKFYGRLEIIGDKSSGGIMQISHSGNDYVTWSTPRLVDLNASRSQVYLSGSDRRRAWQFLCTSNSPFRLESAEIDFRIGEMDQEQNVGGGTQYRR
jgi:hypothetical protein